MTYNENGMISAEDLLNYVPGEGSNVFDNDFNWVVPDDAGSLATSILNNFNGPWGSNIINKDVGSSLPTYDVNHEDAYKIIQLSLITELFKNSDLYECYLTGAGEVKYHLIGDNGASPDSEYSYLKGESYAIPCDNVIVSGFDPPPKRIITEDKAISLFELSAGEDDGDEVYFLARDEQVFKGAEAGNCQGMYRYGSIEYPVIDWDDTQAMKAAFALEKYDTVIAYNYRVNIPFYGEGLTKVDHKKTTLRYYTLTNFGRYYPIAAMQATGNLASLYIACMGFEEIPSDYKVNISENTNGMGPYSGKACNTGDIKFIDVTNVYIQGFFLEGIWPKINDDKAVDKFWVKATTMKPTIHHLKKDEHYTITSNGSDFYITFLGGAPKAYQDYFMHGAQTTGFSFEPGCIFTKSGDDGMEHAEIGSTDNVTGFLADDYGTEGASQVSSSTVYTTDDYALFPIGKGSQGYAVKSIILEVAWDNPSLIIEHTRGFTGSSSDVELNEEQLRTVEVMLYPIVIRNEPAPMWIKGAAGSMALHEAEFDTDIATVQDMSVTDYVKAMSALEKGDIQISLPFLGAEDVEAAAEEILNLANDEGVDSTYIFGPDTDVELGQAYGGGFINEINYNYQDQSQYTISVRIGPKWRDLGQGWANSLLTVKTTDKSGLKGIVREAGYNGAEHQVEVEKLGLIPCLNKSPTTMVHTGDIVDVTVKNIPVGLL